MKLPGYYSSGEFARMAQVSLRTIRFYDKKNILKPSYVTPSGARFYTDSDFARLQQILLLKYLGFSLDDIREMLIEDTDYHFLLNSLNIQKKLVHERMEQMQMVASAIEDTVQALEQHHQVDWSHMLDLIHLTGVEQNLKKQYQNASNISARIRLHREYSQNPQGWFPWIYEHCQLKCGMHILEIGCGNGALWTEQQGNLPEHIHIVLSDISEGMIHDVRRNIHIPNTDISFASFDCHNIPYPDQSFDLVIANHVLFYCEDIPKVCQEVHRVLKDGGIFLCSTYGKKHMQEITDLVKEFDKRIALSAESLYEHFGLENGAELLAPYFSKITRCLYDDTIVIDKAEPLIEYILSCHGNQNRFLMDKYSDFRSFVEHKVSKTFHITKDAGLFLCEK